MSNNDLLGKLVSSTELRVSGLRVNSAKPPKRVFNYYMEPAFDDWRRYMANYYLYLPYVGVVGIDAEKYVGHTMSLDLIFDTRTGSLKYNLLCDNVVLNSYAGDVRISMPVTASSPFSASRNRVVTATETGVGAITSMARGNFIGAIEGTAKGLMDITKPLQKNSLGGYSPSTSVFDSLHVYLIVEAPEIYYGDGIVERYGLPDNRYETIGNLSGYVELTDVDLHVVATDAEIDEIKSLLFGGVVI